MKNAWLGAVALGLLVAVACGNESASPTTDAPGGGGDGQGGAKDDDQPGHAGSNADEGGAGGEAPQNAGGMSQIPSDAGAGGTELGGAGGVPNTGPKLSAISGHIYTWYGSPLAAAAVSVNGVSTATDEDGAFMLEDIPEVYDLTIVDNSGLAVEVVEGLTSRDIKIPLFNRPNPKHGSVAGKLSGGAGFPMPKGHLAQVALGADAPMPRGSVNLIPGDFAYTLDASWDQESTLAAEVFALQWAHTANMPTSFTGFGKKAVTLTVDGTLGSEAGDALTNVVLTKPKERTIAGSLKIAGKPTKTVAYLDLGRVFTIELPLKVGDVSVVVPDVGLDASLEISAEYATGAQSLNMVPAPVGAAGWDVNVVSPPSLSLPVDKATKLAKDATFSWSAQPEHTYSAITWTGDMWTVSVLTADTAKQFPPVDELGIDVTGTEVAWRVDTFGPVDSVEEAATLTNYRERAWLKANLRWGMSQERGFQFDK